MRRVSLLLPYLVLIAAIGFRLQPAWMANEYALQVSHESLLGVLQQPADWPFKIKANVCHMEVYDSVVAPVTPKQTYLAGILHLACGDVAGAREYLRPAAEDATSISTAPLAYAASEIADGHIDLAIQIWQSRLGDPWRLLLYLAERDYVAGELKQAASRLDVVTALLDAPAVIERVALYNQACIVYREANLPDKAVPVCQKLVEVSSRGIHWMLLGRAYLQADNDVAAIVALQQALHLEPENGVFYFYLGQAYEGQSRFPDAWAAYQKSMQLAPTYGWVRLHVAALEAARGNIQQAITHLNVARESDDAAVRRQAEIELSKLMTQEP